MNMTFFSILERLLIGPLKLVFEIIFDYANRFTGHPGLAIVFLSLAINILVLPLYRRADAMQEETRDREALLHDGVAHIKKAFSGDERMMILQTYYRQMHYRPMEALNGSVSLLLEIPFFIAAYQFLSRLTLLDGVSLFLIKDLSQPDGLIKIGGIAMNLLPILMTLVNVISSSLYLKGFPLKTKIQLYGMSLFFLVFLYTSPSGLVFYWTLNNVFSLVKTIFYKLKEPQKVLRCLCAAAGLAALALGAAVFGGGAARKGAFLLGLGVLLLLPMFLFLLHKAGFSPLKGSRLEPDRRLFLSGTVFLTVLIGLLIPSVFIAASPQEYVDINAFQNPLWYLVSSACLAAGTFLIWMRVFYWLASPTGKAVFERIILVLCGAAIINYMFFGTNLGIISTTLKYEHGLIFTGPEKLINIFVLGIVAIALLAAGLKWKRTATTVLLVSILALSGMSVLNVFSIKGSVDRLTPAAENRPQFRLSKTGQNVVVIMLDRALGEYVPYIFNEKPELKEQFSGFTYYRNTISFGGYTNFGVPALAGGYEYTPVEMNKRSGEPLVEKHDEALKVMPAIFSENGYEVTVCDPPYANYQWIPDLTIYDDFPEVNTYITKGYFSSVDQSQADIENNHRNFFCFSVMKCMPLFLQPTWYNNGRYHNVRGSIGQIRQGISISSGIDTAFTDPYYVLVNLPAMTDVTGEGVNTFLFLANDSTHEPMLLQEPDYVPAEIVNNTEYDAEHAGRFILDGNELLVKNENHMIHYHANMAAMIQIGKWFDFLRENEVYDNTRIILVSDHGREIGQLKALVDALIIEGYNPTSLRGVEHFFPLLMVKDFNSDGIVVSDTFMTNADVPVLAMEGLIQSPVNPFTGKVISSDEKNAHDQFIIVSNDWHVETNSGNSYLPAQWVSVRDDIWNRENWTFYGELVVLDEHAAP